MKWLRGGNEEESWRSPSRGNSSLPLQELGTPSFHKGGGRRKEAKVFGRKGVFSSSFLSSFDVEFLIRRLDSSFSHPGERRQEGAEESLGATFFLFCFMPFPALFPLSPENPSLFSVLKAPLFPSSSPRSVQTEPAARQDHRCSALFPSV